MRLRTLSIRLCLTLCLAPWPAVAKVRVVEAVLGDHGPMLRTQAGEVHAVRKMARTPWLIGRVPKRCSALVPDGDGAWCTLPAQRPGAAMRLYRVDLERSERRSWQVATSVDAALPGRPVGVVDGGLALEGGWLLRLGEAKTLERRSEAPPLSTRTASPLANRSTLGLGESHGRSWTVDARHGRPLTATVLETGVVEHYRIKGPHARRWGAVGSSAGRAVVVVPVVAVSSVVGAAIAPIRYPIVQRRESRTSSAETEPGKPTDPTPPASE